MIATSTIGVLALIVVGIGYAHYAGMLPLGFLGAEDSHGDLLYLARTNGKWVYIDAAGRVVSPVTEADGSSAYVEPRTAVGPPYLAMRDGKSVYVNPRGEVLFAAASFAWVGAFREGLAPARAAAASGRGRENNLGFIDLRGQFVIEPHFAQASDFSSGLAAASTDGAKWGYIDKSGRFVIEPRFERAGDFKDDIAEVRESGEYRYRLIDRSGNPVGTIQSEYTRLEELGLETEETISEGKWVASVDGRWGFVDTRGNWVIEPQFSRVGLFRAGLAPASPANGSPATGEEPKVGFIDQSGKFVIAPRFEEAGEFHHGLAWVVIDDKLGYIDRTGKTVIPPRYDEASSFIGEIARVVEAGKMSYIDVTGRVVWSPDSRNIAAAASSPQADRAASVVTPAITERKVTEVLAEIDSGATSRNVDVIYARLGKNARIDLTVEGFGPRQTLSFDRDEYRVHVQQSFGQVGNYEYRRDNTRIAIAPDGQRATVTGEIYETASFGGTTLTSVSAEEATFGIEDGRVVITAVRTLTRPQ